MIAAVNHGVCSPERCRSLRLLLDQLDGWRIPHRVVRGSPTALDGAARTLAAALDAKPAAARVLYIEDDAELCPDFPRRIEQLEDGCRALLPDGVPAVVFLFSARMEADHTVAGARPVEGAVGALMSRAAVRRAVELAPGIRGGVPVERLLVNAAAGDDATTWPSLVQHRGELVSVHRPGSGGQGTRSPSYDARYSR